MPEQVEAMHAVYCASVINLAALLFPMSSPTGNGHTQGPSTCVFENLVGPGSDLMGVDHGSLMESIFCAVTGYDFGDAVSDKLARQCTRARALITCNPDNVVHTIVEIAQQNGNSDGLMVTESFSFATGAAGKDGLGDVVPGFFG